MFYLIIAGFIAAIEAKWFESHFGPKLMISETLTLLQWLND